MAKASAVATSQGINRREFLYYIWGASMALFTAELTGAIIWFLIPRFREGEFGGKFPLAITDVPDINTPPVANTAGRFWLVNLDSAETDGLMRTSGEGSPENIKGIAAIYKVCTHLGCIYDWNAANDRFQCPCHGSKYRLDGRRIEDPAPRTLDRFKIEAYDATGNVIAESKLNDDTGFFDALVLPPETASIAVDTGSKKEGPSQDLLCDLWGTCS